MIRQVAKGKKGSDTGGSKFKDDILCMDFINRTRYRVANLDLFYIGSCGNGFRRGSLEDTANEKGSIWLDFDDTNLDNLTIAEEPFERLYRCIPETRLSSVFLTDRRTEYVRRFLERHNTLHTIIKL
jgi:hypothetical protein